MNLGIAMAERRLVPDFVLRTSIRTLLRRRLAAERARAGAQGDFVRAMASAPIALHTTQANQQHYEVPAAFFGAVLGPQRKYSSCLWTPGVDTLSGAEDAMLALTGERARLEDGQRVLELGCGWGSLSLWMARRYRRSRIVAVSNSHSQRAYIEERAAFEGLDNLEVITADMNAFDIQERFDRVVSVEMIEHMRNWERLLGRVRGWLAPEGLCFLHFFAHRSYAYPFETEADDDWMGRHFFTGGMMPSADLLARLRLPFSIVSQWQVSGRHYARTAEAWLDNLDRRASEVERLFERQHGAAEAELVVQRWRMFFLACAELFGFDAGREWLVMHALLSPHAEVYS